MKKNKKIIDQSWRGLFITKAFDLLIVIVGVTIAFQLSNLKENRDERALERFYLESLVTDLDKDLEEYESNLAELRVDHKLVRSCLLRMENQENVADSIGLVVLNILSIKTFEGHQNTYSTLLNGNVLNLIQDGGIRNLMMEHYRLYSAIHRFEEAYMNVTTRLHDYFSVYLDYNHVRNLSDQDFIKKRQTKNFLTISTVQLQNGIWRYEGSIEKARELKESILTFLKE